MTEFKQKLSECGIEPVEIKKNYLVYEHNLKIYKNHNSFTVVGTGLNVVTDKLSAFYIALGYLSKQFDMFNRYNDLETKNDDIINEYEHYINEMSMG